MAGRDRTCYAPRFRRALYRLSYGHTSQRPCAMYAPRYLRHLASPPPRPTWRARLAQARCEARPKAAHPSGKRSGRGTDGRGWSRTSGLLFVRQALIPSELLAREPVCRARLLSPPRPTWRARHAHARCDARPKAAPPSGKRSGRGEQWAGLESNQPPLPYQRSALPPELPARRAPGRGLEPQSPRSERGVLPFRRSRIGAMQGGVRHVSRLRPSPSTRRSTHQRDPVRERERPSSLSRSARSRTMFSKPLANPSTLDRRNSVAHREIAVLRGGALEPEPRALFRKITS